jgi:hypothetical protein
MVDALEHGFLLDPKHRLFAAVKARIMRQREKFSASRYNSGESESRSCRYFALLTT